MPSSCQYTSYSHFFLSFLIHNNSSQWCLAPNLPQSRLDHNHIELACWSNNQFPHRQGPGCHLTLSSWSEKYDNTNWTHQNVITIKKTNILRNDNKWTFTYIKENNIAIGISIMQVNAIKTLRELYITCFLAKSRIHHETHCFFQSFAVIEIVITIDIQKIGTICQDGWNSNLQYCKYKPNQKKNQVLQK